MAMRDNEIIDILPEFTVNMNGVQIKKCCSSCKYHDALDDKGHRLCTYDGAKKTVFKSEVCKHWEISDAINGIRTIGHGV